MKNKISEPIFSILKAISLSLEEISFPRLIVVPLSMSEPDGARNQEQIAASHEIDGVRKEKERLTAASLNKPAAIHRRSVLAISVLVLPAVTSMSSSNGLPETAMERTSAVNHFPVYERDPGKKMERE